MGNSKTKTSNIECFSSKTFTTFNLQNLNQNKFNVMKPLVTLVFLCCSILTAWCQNKETDQSNPNPVKKIQIVDAACGECKLGLKGTACNLAIRIDGKSYFLDGADIDSQGDAHANNGFCNTIKKAEVQGELVNGRFKATYFKLIAEPKGKDK